MSLQSGAEGSTGYLSRLFTIVSTSATQLISAPSQPHRTEARRRLARHTLPTSAVAAVLIAVLMIWFDAQEIALMPPRGTASLWPVRILTDFGKDNYVLLLLAVPLLAVALVAPAMYGPVGATVACDRFASAIHVARGIRTARRRRVGEMDRRTGPPIRWRRTPTPSTLLPLRQPKPTPAFHPRMRSRPLRWLLR